MQHHTCSRGCVTSSFARQLELCASRRTRLRGGVMERAFSPYLNRALLAAQVPRTNQSRDSEPDRLARSPWTPVSRRHDVPLSWKIMMLAADYATLVLTDAGCCCESGRKHFLAASCVAKDDDPGRNVMTTAGYRRSARQVLRPCLEAFHLLGKVSDSVEPGLFDTRMSSVSCQQQRDRKYVLPVFCKSAPTNNIYTAWPVLLSSVPVQANPACSSLSVQQPIALHAYCSYVLLLIL
jgi:hypothetical protein